MGRPKAPGGAGLCCSVALGLGSGDGVGDDGFAVANGDVLAGEFLELGGEVAEFGVWVREQGAPPTWAVKVDP